MLERDTDGITPRRPSWLIAAMLSLFMPGLGHLHAGSLRGAMLVLGSWLLFGTALYLSGLLRSITGAVVFVVLTLVAYAAVIFSAVMQARRCRDLPSWRRPSVYLPLLVLLLFAQCTVILDFYVAISPVRTFEVPGRVMVPALQPGERIAVDVAAFETAEPRRGDLTTFHISVDPGLRLFRIIGLPGEEIEIRSEQVLINGQVFHEPWTTSWEGGHPGMPVRARYGPQRLPPDAVFLLGDNRAVSYDSRYFGPVAVTELRGRALYIYWSRDLSRIGQALGGEGSR